MPVKEIVNGHESGVARTDVRIAYRVNAGRVELRIRVWGNRQVWIDVRRASKSGWVWEFTAEGRFIPTKDSRDLVAKAEDTIDASYLPDNTVAAAMGEIWSACLASGPRPV